MKSVEPFGAKGEPKGFTWDQYRDLIIATHRQPPPA
jgi:hypothetical protein